MQLNGWIDLCFPLISISLHYIIIMILPTNQILLSFLFERGFIKARERVFIVHVMEIVDCWIMIRLVAAVGLESQRCGLRYLGNGRLWCLIIVLSCIFYVTCISTCRKCVEAVLSNNHGINNNNNHHHRSRIWFWTIEFILLTLKYRVFYKYHLYLGVVSFCLIWPIST